MKVQDYLRANGLEKLQEEFSIVVTDYPDRIVLNYDQIKSPRFQPICDECRALILRKSSYAVLSRAFDRFYNVGEGTGWQDFPVYKARFDEKLDGSLLSVYNDDNEWCVSTRKMAFAEGTTNLGSTFRQVFDRAEEKTKLFEVLEHHQKHDSSPISVADYTWIFELTSPETRIVTPYEETSITLIGARIKESGFEIKGEDLDAWAKEFECKRPKAYQFHSLDQVTEAAGKLDVMEEGFVLVVEREGSFWRLKCKNEKFVAIAHMRDNGGISPKRIMTLLINNEKAEYLSYFPEDEKYFNFLEDIYQESVDRIKKIYKDAKSIEEQKEFALTIIPQTKYSHERGVLFNMRKGEDLYKILKNMGGKRISLALGLREKFKREFGVENEDEKKD